MQLKARSPSFHDGFSQELRIASPDDGRLSWIGGAYFAQTDLDVMIAINNDFGQGFQEQRTAPNIGGIAPTAETISTFKYPGARPLFIYVKGEHLAAIPGIREFVAEFAKGWAAGGYLARRGLIASPADKLAAQNQAARELKPMTADGLK